MPGGRGLLQHLGEGLESGLAQADPCPITCERLSGWWCPAVPPELGESRRDGRGLRERRTARAGVGKLGAHDEDAGHAQSTLEASVGESSSVGRVCEHTAAR